MKNLDLAIDRLLNHINADKGIVVGRSDRPARTQEELNQLMIDIGLSDAVEAVTS